MKAPSIMRGVTTAPAPGHSPTPIETRVDVAVVLTAGSGYVSVLAESIN